MPGFIQRVGRAILELTTDRTGYAAGLKDAHKELKGFSASVKTFAKEHDKSFRAVGQGLAIAGSAVAATTAAVVALGRHGADVNDVAGEFKSLSARAGETSAVMLGALQRGTKNTISNFELMKASNKAMGAGLVATSEDFQTLAAGARLTANRVGTDTVEAFETLTSAMASGRTAQLKQLGLFVDSKAAVQAYAKAHRMSVSDMTDAHRAAALQTGTLAALRRELQAAGTDTRDFADATDQFATMWVNFRDDMASAIASSSVVTEFLTGIGEAMKVAFGTDQSERVKTMTGVVNTLALQVGDFATVVLEAGRVATRVWTFMKGGILGILEAQFRLRAALRDLIPTEQYKAEAAQLRAMADSLQQQTEEAWQQQLVLEGGFNAVGAALERMRGRMAAAAAEQSGLSTETDKTVGATKRHTAAADLNAAALKRQTAAANELAQIQNENAERERNATLERLQFADFVGERKLQDLAEEAQTIQAAEREATEAMLARVAREKAATLELYDWLGERRMKDAEDGFAQRQAADEKLKAQHQALLEAMRERWVRFAEEMTFSVTNGVADMLVGLRSFKDGAIGIWQDLRRSVANILSQMLADLIGGYVSKAVRALAGIAGGGGGFGGGKAGQLANAAIGIGTNVGLGALSGGGAAAVGVGAGAAAAGIPAGLPLIGGTGLVAPGAAGAGGAGAGLAGLATNPIGWAIGAGLLLTWGIKQKGWFRGGEEGTKVNPRRDKLVGQFGPSGTGPGSGFANINARLRSPQLSKALFGADTVAEFEAAQTAVVNRFAMMGQSIKSFSMGGFVPPGVVQLAWLHGGRRGEVVAPLDRAQSAPAPATTHTTIIQAPLYIQGVMDAGTVAEVHRKHLVRLQNDSVRRNTGGAATEIRRMMRGQSHAFGV